MRPVHVVALCIVAAWLGFVMVLIGAQLYGP